MTTQTLSSGQAHALFDILSHHESYAEIQNLKAPETLVRFGFPLESSAGQKTSSPLLQALLKRFIVALPGLRNVSQEFWTRRIQGLVSSLAMAELSESYDKGSVGIRKTLSTAIAAMVESFARGCLGGFPMIDIAKDRKYNVANPEDVKLAWDCFLQELIYGNMVDEIFDKAASTDQLKDHTPIVQAAHEYVVVTFASFLHYILVVSPRGPSLIPLIIRLNDLMPYFLIRQTLKVGNAASMMNGMIKLLLAKVNMSTITTWFGGQESDKGMNLLQQIISSVLGWDSNVLKKRVASIENEKDRPGNAQLDVLKAYGGKSAEEHHFIRSESKSGSNSIVQVILSKSAISTDLSEKQHDLAMEYLAILLAIRDRDEIAQALCHGHPDLFTNAIRDIVSAYDPIIRALHNAVNLTNGVSDLENFLHDLIDLSRTDAKSKRTESPTVEDFVRLVKTHQGSSHRFIHQTLSYGKELAQIYREYAKHAAAQYRQKNPQPISVKSNGVAAAGDLTSALNDLVQKQPEQDRIKILKQIDAHEAYLSELADTSNRRMKSVIENSTRSVSQTTQGPGMYLQKWEALLDSTEITPATSEGPVRSGASESVKDATRVDVDGTKRGLDRGSAGERSSRLKAPHVGVVVDALQFGFQEILRAQSGD